MRLKVTFPVCNTHNSENKIVLTAVCLRINWKVHTACDLNFIVKGDGFLKVAGSHVHWKVVISGKRCKNRPLRGSDRPIRIQPI